MKKRLYIYLVCICLVLPSVNAFAMNAEFSVTPIKQDLDTKRLSFKVKLPNTVSNSTLYVAFYTDGVLSMLTPLDSSAATSFSKTVKYSVTPDDIRLMMWSKGSLKPLSSSADVLTEATLSQANSLVEDLLSKVEDTTDSIRDLLMPKTKPEDVEIQGILNAIDNCASKAIKADYGKEHLLTSDFCKTMFAEELKAVQSLYSSASSKAKERLENLYLNYLEDEYAEVITDFMGFFDIKLEF